ncbi:MAG: chemotaxis response regulator protein-glutamate methylesterase [Actinobacteria bacterium HGW-Actinobacteria-6]|jgi:two-component system chemotaxis response regulator CheB|nr:MAG: chemotaxis response regulator protein-glutamate methylesterase [Actinobacteria bacterium HGW-Actinobacteria-6]
MLAQILATDPAIEVVGQAIDGQAGVDMVARLKPDLVTMDIHMPKMDGLEATERIMAYTPTPILVVSSSVHGVGMGRAFDALSAGALEVIKKPEPRDWADLERIGRDVIRKVKILAKVKVITHIRGRRGASPHRGVVPAPPVAEGYGIIAIGSSTGGPSALMNVLKALPRSFPLPIVIAQHIAEGFIPGLVSWLDSGCTISVRAATDGGSLEPGVAYFAPTGANIKLDRTCARYSAPEPGQLYIPSADTLLSSAARVYGARGIGVLLTGMGADGAAGLKAMHDAGALTIAQDEATSTVFGMPRAAIELGAAGSVLAIQDIGAEILRVVSR